MENLESLNYAEIAIGGFGFILFLLFTVTIKRNSDNIFFSMRSSNLMIITNALIFFSIATYVLNDILYEEYNGNNNLRYISTFYSLFQIGIFISLTMRYFRLFLSCRNPEDSQNVQYNLFETKYYHYEYFYVRLIAVSILLALIASLVNYFVGNKNVGMFIYEIEFINNNNKNKDDIDGCFYFWIIFSFLQTAIFTTFDLLISKTHLNPDVYISQEISLVAFVNYIYSLSIGLSFLIKHKVLEKDNFIKGTITLIPLIYNLFIYFIVIALPFLYGVFNSTVIIYDLPGELCESLYLFLTKEKCFDAFHNYLKTNNDIIRNQNDREKGVFLLDLLICIFKFRLLVTNNESRTLIAEEINSIRINYLERGDLNNYLDKNLVQETIDLCTRYVNSNTLRANIFDKVAAEAYQFLDNKFKNFKASELFNKLKNELTEETNIRCKLTNFGLIRN
jgi:hypothetical protein